MSRAVPGERDCASGHACRLRNMDQWRRAQSSYHGRWLWIAIKSAPFVAGGAWALGAAIVVGGLVAVLSAPTGKDPMTIGIEAIQRGVIATLAVLAVLVVIQLVLAPRRIEISARAEAEARERGLRDQIVSLAPPMDAELTATALSVRPYVESRRITGPDLPSPIVGIEYTNGTASALGGCAVIWEGLESPTNFGWTKVDWFPRHGLIWDDTGQREIRIASGQSRRVELVTRWPGGAVAVVRLPGDSGDGSLLAEGFYQVSLSVVANGYRARKEQYRLNWADGQLSVDESGDLFT